MPLTFHNDKITVEIKSVNCTELSYIYNTNFTVDKDDRYLEAIKEAIEQFTEDKSVQSLLQWDGKLKYKISL
jgi:hypothetical protein